MTPERHACLQILARAILDLDVPHPVRVAIDGPDAAGKTVLADELAPLIELTGRPVLRASIDGFHRPRPERLARGPESPEGYFFDSFDYPALRTMLLQPLGPGGNRLIGRRAFDYRTDKPVAAPGETIESNAVLLFDGVFLMRRELAGCWDFAAFIDVPFEETVRRAIERDRVLFGSDEETARRYANRYGPGQQLYHSHEQPRARANVVVDNTNPDHPRLTWRDGGRPDGAGPTGGLRPARPGAGGR